MSRLRVCLVASHFAEYGFALGAALQPHAEVLLVACRENTTAELGEHFVAGSSDGFRIHFFRKSRNPLRTVAEAAGIVRAVRAFQPDVLHVQEDSKDALALALPWLGRVPVLLTVHDPKPHSGDDTRVRRRTRHGLYIAQLRRRADALLVHGERLVADAREVAGGRPRPVHVLPHGPLGERCMAHSQTAQEPGRCLFFGRIEAYKGLRHFIAVIKNLNTQGLSVRGVVAGRGSDLEPHRATLVADPAFELIEKFLSPQEVATQFLRADVVVMPYENATQSGVAALALGAGRPVLAFDVGALAEMVLDGHTGLLVAPGDLGALTTALAGLVTDRGLNKRLGTGARHRATKEFSWSHIAAGSLHIYTSLVHGHR